MADWGLELDQWVRLVVRIGRAGLAVGAEVSVMADSTLVTISRNVGRVAGGTAERTIAADADVHRTMAIDAGIPERLIDGDESVAGVNETGINDTLRAVVPVGAV